MIRRPTNVLLLTDCHRKATLSKESLPETEISDPIMFAHVGYVERTEYAQPINSTIAAKDSHLTQLMASR
ncbi:hypothetical protein HYDPIDRAFT_119454 [Hydnomerulius pinastri MD-312]|uniref:Unplaced genomic scaffold scaffold_97, whole genome shotgun sequence n=1 Tax=Hydnomerulius pinastri MD-312 TaxID=994086 RepID=A0A0C9VYP6_9AGAM|nr:hypothetical protein HYDPIDRAFT_119454 [Hydnomerulius pinastri MD-312]